MTRYDIAKFYGYNSVEEYEEAEKRENEIFLKGLEKQKSCVEKEPVKIQPISQWISVEDRLPDIGERVFVYIPRPDNHYNIEIAHLSEGNDCPYWVLRDKSQFYSIRCHYISHWMPFLIEPPMDGDTE